MIPFPWYCWFNHHVIWLSYSCRAGVVWAADLNFVDDEFKSRSDQKLAFFEIVPSSTLRLCLHVVNWSAPCHLGLLTHKVDLLYSIAICVVESHQPMADNCQPTHQIMFLCCLCKFQCLFISICLGVLTYHLPRLLNMSILSRWIYQKYRMK